MNSLLKRMPTVLAPIFGAGAIGACPLCWAGSASLLTFLGLGGIIPYWRWISYPLFGLGVIGFIFDYRSHGNPYPLVMLTLGAVLVQVGTNVFAGGAFPGLLLWVTGGLLVAVGVIYNKRLFPKPEEGAKVSLGTSSGTPVRNDK